MRLRRTAYDENYHSPVYRSKPDSQRNQLRLREITKHKSGGKLLDVGCGRGDFLIMAESRYNVHGVDRGGYASDSELIKIRARIKRINIEEDDLEGEFDVITVFNVLEHLVDPASVIQKLIRHLAPRGLLFGSVPHNDQMVGRLHTTLTNFFDKTHLSTFAPSVWLRFFKEAGFQEVQFFGEVMAGAGTAAYIRKPWWKYLAFNLIFACKADDRVIA